MKRCFSASEHENLYRQTPSIWLQRSVGLAAWLWLAPVAEAQPTYTPVPLDNPTPQADARFAEAVAGIGDVNGDGVTDLLVGAPQQFLAGNINQGRAFVFSGADRSLLLTLNHPAPQQGLALFGSAVSGAGDVNRDGRPDLLVGAPEQTVGGRVNQGQAYVLSGADGRLLLTLNNPIPQADAEFGAAVAGGGDVNGDGAPDLLVGAPEQGASSQGQAFVFSGADGRLLLTLDDPSSSFDFGEAVAGAGDVNGDGAPDLLVGNGFGRDALVFSGADGSVLRTLDRPPDAGDFGEAVAGIGDVNGDGAPDLLVGAPSTSVAGEIGQGRAFVFSGADASLLRTLDLPVLESVAFFGSAVAAAGDVNGDGVPDLLVGAPDKDVSEFNQGQAFVFSGTDASLLLTFDDPNPESSARLGEVVAGIGDVDGDGAPDFLVGAPGHDVGGNARQGRAYVFVSEPMPPAAGDLPLVPASPQVPLPCNSARCRVPVTCNLAPALGTACTNRIDLFVRVPRRLAEDAAGTRQRRLRLFAVSNATSVPPGQTANVRLRVTRLGRRIVRTSRTRRLNGVLAIRNAPGTVIDTTPVRISLRRR